MADGRNRLRTGWRRCGKMRSVKIGTWCIMTKILTICDRIMEMDRLYLEADRCAIIAMKSRMKEHREHWQLLSRRWYAKYKRLVDSPVPKRFI